MACLLKVLVVGLGSIGRRHIGNLLDLGVDRVEGCSEWRRLKSLALHGTEIPVHNDYEAALNMAPDAVVVANPTSLHAQYAKRAIESGCAVYLEKPAGTSVGDVQSLLAAVTARCAKIAVGYQYRFHPGVERLRSEVAAGRFGQLISVQVNSGEYLPHYHPDEDYRSSYAARAELGGGVLLTQIHDINYLRWIFGTPASAYAVGGKTSDLQIDVEDSVSALLTFRQGPPVLCHQDYLQRPARRTMAVIGQEGSAFWDGRANTLCVVDVDGTEKRETDPGFDRNQMFQAAMRNFLDAITSGVSPRCDLADAAADLAVVDALRASLTSGREESVHDFEIVA